MIKKIAGLLLILILIFTTSCSKSSKMESNSAAPKAPEYSDSGQPSKGSATPGAVTDIAVEQDKKIIQNHVLQLTALDLKILSKDVKTKAEELGGYVQNDEANESFLRAVVRVPSDKADSFVEHLSKNYEVKNTSSKIDDITQSYVDLEARLKNLKAQETQILEILKKANSVDEILRVQNEIFRVRGEIESLEANKKMWDRLIDYATISINATKNEIIKQPGSSIISGSEFFKAIYQGLKNSVVGLILGLQKIIIFLIGNILWIAILAAIGVVGYKRYAKSLKSLDKKNENKD